MGFPSSAGSGEGSQGSFSEGRVDKVALQLWEIGFKALGVTGCRVGCGVGRVEGLRVKGWLRAYGFRGSRRKSSRVLGF